jgi:hypothetical protein
MGLQSRGSPNFGTPTWESREKMTFGCKPHDHQDLQHTPLPPKCCKLRSIPNSLSFRCFHVWTCNWIYEGVWGCIKDLLIAFKITRYMGWWWKCLLQSFWSTCHENIEKSMKITLNKSKFQNMISSTIQIHASIQINKWLILAKNWPWNSSDKWKSRWRNNINDSREMDQMWRMLTWKWTRLST